MLPDTGLEISINPSTACMFYLTDSRQERAMGSPKKHLQLDCVLRYLPLVSLRLVRWYMLHKLTLVMLLTTALLLPRSVLPLASSHVQTDLCKG